MNAHIFLLIRYGLLGALLLFSLITLALAASLIGTIPAGGIVPDYLGLDLAIGVITLVVVTPSLVIDFFRKGAFTSMVIVELAWGFVLMILWIAAAGDTAAVLTGLSCVFVDDFTGEQVNGGAAESQCHELQALEAFPWLNFIILLTWLITLIFLATTAHTRGNTSVWTSSITGTDFFAHSARPATSAPQMQPNAGYGGSPMQQQHSGPPATGYSQASYPPSGYNATPPQHYQGTAAQV